MSIKPVTYQGATNFRANLYALEIRSRFIDQDAADGYYKDYGNELNATVSSNIITIGSGALLIQGRLNEIESGGEAVPVVIQNGYVGYIIARIETYHPSDTENCTIFARTGVTLSAIPLTKEDTYQKSADSQNKAYEIPLYSFSMSDGAITDLVKLISPIEENTRTRDIANEALEKIDEAIKQINTLLGQSYAVSAETANNVSAEKSTKDVDRHIWFSDNEKETSRNYDDNFTYNPGTKTLKVEKINGSLNNIVLETTIPSGSTITEIALPTELSKGVYVIIHFDTPYFLSVTDDATATIFSNGDVNPVSASYGGTSYSYLNSKKLKYIKSTKKISTVVSIHDKPSALPDEYTTKFNFLNGKKITICKII